MPSKVKVWIEQKQLAIFLIVTFVYTWVFQSLLVAFAPEKAQESVFYIPSIYGPTIAALAIPLLTGGWKSLAEFLKKRLFWKVSIAWYLIALLCIPFLLLAGRGLHLLIFPSVSLPPMVIEKPYTGLLIGFVIMLPFGPLGEELGWRGFALPELQTRMNALSASLILGVIWWVWHLPQLLIPELKWAVGGMTIFNYLLLMLPGSVLTAWIFNNSNGSALLTILFHASMNFFLGLLGFNSPYFLTLLIGLLWGAAILVTIICGPTLLIKSTQDNNQNSAVSPVQV